METLRYNSRAVEAKQINDRLQLMYGTNVNVNKANFRLILAGNCYEKRAGEIQLNGIFLKDAVKEIKKYPWLSDGQWIVERLIPNSFQDVMEGGWSYECIYAFPYNLFPIWRAIEHLIHCLFNPSGPRTQKEADYNEAERILAEKQKIRDMLDTTVLETSLNDGNAISYSNTKGISYRPSHLRLESVEEEK